MWRGRSVLLPALILAVFVINCQKDRPNIPVRCNYEVIDVIPHRPDAFTQGLVMDRGVLIEGTGLYGHSAITKIRPDTGHVIQAVHLPAKYFGEGLTVLGGRIYQLTWQEGTAFVYDRDSLELIQQFHYQGEGWGLTNDGKDLIMSDGSERLLFLDANSFQVKRAIVVHDNNGPVRGLNELEFVKGLILANIWQTGMIAVIDPADGHVTGYIDIHDLWSRQPAGCDVPNGIAYDPDTGDLLVTGKLWQWIYRLRITGDLSLVSPKKY